MEALFSGYPVNNRRTLKVKLEEVGKFPSDDCSLFEKLMGSLNPFSQYIIREMLSSETTHKSWQLDESIFGNKPDVKPEFLTKTSSEMFVIYKFTQDSSLKVKSEKYTHGEFVECKELLPKEESSLFESQIVNRAPIAPAAADDNPFLN